MAGKKRCHCEEQSDEAIRPPSILCCSFHETLGAVRAKTCAKGTLSLWNPFLPPFGRETNDLSRTDRFILSVLTMTEKKRCHCGEQSDEAIRPSSILCCSFQETLGAARAKTCAKGTLSLWNPFLPPFGRDTYYSSRTDRFILSVLAMAGKKRCHCGEQSDEAIRPSSILRCSFCQRAEAVLRTARPIFLRSVSPAARPRGPGSPRPGSSRNWRRTRSPGNRKTPRPFS